MGRLRRLARIPRSYASLAWWGLVTPRGIEREPLVVVQAVVLAGDRVLLTTRMDLHGWELPGGTVTGDEAPEDAVRREVLEETGITVAVERHVGDYIRTGFRPHTAHVFRCRALAGEPQASSETPMVAWFALARLPDTLFPWYAAPIADALPERAAPVVRHERQGLGWIWASAKIDIRMRLTNDLAGLPRP